MRILQLSPKPPYPPKDGGAIASLFFAKLWQKLGYEVRVLAMATPKHPAPSTPPSHFAQQTVYVDTSLSPAAALANLLFSDLPYHVERFYKPAYEKALAEVMQSYRPDLIQVESPYLTPYVTAYDTPRVYRLHNVEHQIWQRLAQEKKGPLRWYLSRQARRIRNYEARVLSHYSGLLPISEKEATWAFQCGYEGPIEIIPFAIDVHDYQAPPLRKRDPHIGYIGGLDWLPNVSGLIWFLEKVWPPFVARHPKAQFFIAGRNCPPSLKRHARQNVHILGEVPDAKAFLYEQDIIVVPLFSGSGIRIKIIEAFAAGRAVISTSVGAESLICHPNINIYIADTAPAFLNALETLYESAFTRQTLGQNARALAEAFYETERLLPIAKRFYEERLVS